MGIVLATGSVGSPAGPRPPMAAECGCARALWLCPPLVAQIFPHLSALCSNVRQRKPGSRH